ncbi:hypothetical protein SAMN05192559_1062 [Halobacillus karajensis]|uniref:hypothetical protein n=1 Tax=Halobacillus karajensis TaxID=195088 RepID=UPI0008A7F115|nr:hypothetical protein [Halobacillus karajensis]SEH94651.1 hypothetical protein SAMN05192559_1062 [Halobacillus karajensis]
MKSKPEERCAKCNGWGIDWDDVFDKRIDQITDTQGLSYYDAIEQAKADHEYQENYWNCKDCGGTGINKI